MHIPISQPTDVRMLEALECELIIRLPDRFRNWQLTVGACKFDESSLFAYGHSPHDAESMRAIFGLGSAHRSYDIREQILDNLWILRMNHLPIGVTESGSIVSLSLIDFDESIYYIDILLESDAKGFRPVVRVGADIESFIGALYK